MVDVGNIEEVDRFKPHLLKPLQATVCLRHVISSIF
jgi:hypothetical protein